MSIPTMLNDQQIVAILKAIQRSNLSGKNEVITAMLNMVYELKFLRGEIIGSSELSTEINRIVQSLVDEIFEGE